MIFSALTILMVLLLAFIWANRGFYSALIHMACTIVAGAIAFAVWEPLGNTLVNASPQRGIMSALEGVAWGLALAAPFAISLVLLRLVMDQILARNIIVSTAANYAGASVCGLIASVIATGIFALSVSFFRFVPGPFEVKAVESAANGSITHKGGLWVPVDSIVAGLYSGLSERALRTSDPLARWHPDFHEAGYAMGLTYESKARNTIKSKDFSLLGRVTIGGEGTKLPDLLKDIINPSIQTVENIDGKPLDPASRIEAIVVQFNSTGGESSGKIVLGNGQVRMIIENAQSGERQTVFPVAVTSQADGASPVFGRWRFDARDTFISSVGGGATAPMMFEFPVAPGFEPIALYVRGTRAPIDSTTKALGTFKTAMERDLTIPTLGAALLTGEILKPTIAVAANTDLDTSTAQPVSPITGQSVPEGVRVGNAIGFTIQLGLQRGAEINDKNFFVSGDVTFTKREVTEMGGVDRKLRIGQFLVDSDVSLVGIEVGGTSPFTFLNPRIQSAARTESVTLIDVNGQRYTPVGLVYDDETFYKVRYTPSAPLTTLTEIDFYGTMSRSRPEASMRLLFRVSRRVEIKYFAIGNRALVEFTPPLKAE